MQNFDYTQTQGIYEAPATAKRIPSVCNLPDGWDTVHDRFICYLATHTPLEKGKIPFNEDYKDRYTNAQISTMLFKRFPGLSRTVRSSATLTLFPDRILSAFTYSVSRHASTSSSSPTMIISIFPTASMGRRCGEREFECSHLIQDVLEAFPALLPSFLLCY